MSDPIDRIKQPGDDGDRSYECDCHELSRWKLYSKVVGLIAVVFFAGCIVMGYSLRTRNTIIAVMEAKLQTTPSEVLKRVEQLEKALAVKPSDVLAEVQAIRAELQKIKSSLDNGGTPTLDD